MCLVSILIPTFNQSEYIAQAIQSALDQDYQNLQVIVSDDASTDRTREVVKQFEADPRLSININPNNLGRTANYRKCLFELAKGEWVIVLDGDDYFCDIEYISKAMKAASSDPDIDLVFANAIRVRDDLDGLHELRQNENRNLPCVIEGRELFLSLASRKISLFHNTCVYRREKAISLDFYEKNIISSDWESLHKYILTGKVAFIDETVAIWRIHGENASKTMSVEDRISNLQSVLGPYKLAKSLHIFPQDQVDSWLDQRLERAARKDLRSILKLSDLDGYQQYMQKLHDINPRVYRQLQTSSRLFLRRLKARLDAAIARLQTGT